MPVKSISAIGTRGEAEGKVFTARRDSSGRYVLNRKSGLGTGAPTNYAVNKVYVETLEKAAELLSSDEYLIHLVSDDGKRALREFKMVRIER